MKNKENLNVEKPNMKHHQHQNLRKQGYTELKGGSHGLELDY